jgi:hypothetical protein
MANSHPHHKFEKGNQFAKLRKNTKISEETKKKISDSHKADKCYKWKGGKYRDKRGYVLIYSTEHPYCNSNGYVFEHRLVMEKHIGRVLLPDEVVHHINSIIDDNRIENLMLFANNKLHRNYHKK